MRELTVAKPSTLGNSVSNIVLGEILQVLGNLVRTYNINKTYVDKDDLWSGILTAAAFVIFSTENRLKYYIPGQLVFGRDIILLIKYTVDKELIRQRKQA